MGFKDRHLEDEYLEHLVLASRSRIILGYVTAILLYGSELFASLWVNYDIIIWIGQLYGFMSDEQKEDYKESLPQGFWFRYFPTSTSIVFTFLCLMLLIFILGGFVAYLHWTQ